MNKTTFIIPVYGLPGLLTTCLSTLRKYMRYVPVIVIDDGGPQEKEIKDICNNYNAQYIRKKNGGFASAVNVGIAASVTEYFCLVNSDIEFTKPLNDIIQRTFEEDPDIKVLGGLLLYPDGTIQHGGGYYHYIFQGFAHYGHHKPLHAAKLCGIKAHRIHVTGALFASRRFFWEDYKFDETFVSDSEDADYCLEVWKRGGKVLYDPEFTAIHAEGKTRGSTEAEKMKLDPVRSQRMVDSLYEFRKRLYHTDLEKIDDRINELNEKLHPELPKAFVRDWAMGDVLRSLKIYQRLKEKMIVVTRWPDVFRDEEVEAIATDRDEYAISRFINLDLAYERHPELSIEEAYCKKSGLYFEENSIVPLKTNELDWFRVKRLAGCNWDKPFVIVHARQAQPNRSFPKEEWANLIQNLVGVGLNVILIGDRNDLVAEGRNVFNLVGKTSIHMIRALCERAKLFIGMESGPLHIADGICPAIGIFTMTLPEKRYSPAVTPFMTPVSCRGCLHRAKPPQTDFSCEFGPEDPKQYCCTKTINSDMVLSLAMEVLRKENEK